MPSTIFEIDGLDLRLDQSEWSFATQRRTEIDAHWRQIVNSNTALWNGRILMCGRQGIENQRLVGRFFETDFASFVAWRDWGWPDRSTFNCFGSAAILSSDGAVLMGRMSDHTLNAGKVYPPGGSLEPRDLRDNGEIDILGSIVTELKEETGLAAGDAKPAGLIAVFDEQRISIACGLRFSLTAREIIALAERHWQGEERPELDALVALYDPLQLGPSMPGYAKDIARYFLAPERREGKPPG